MDLLGPCRVDPIHQSPRSRTYGYFTHRTDPPSSPLLIWFPLSSRSSSSAAFPNPFRCRLLGHRLSPASGTTQQSDYWQSTLPLIGSLPPEPPEILPVLLRSRAILPYRAVCNHLVSGG